MKFATVAAVKAFINQFKQNVFESAKKRVEKHGYQVVKPTDKKDNE